MNGKKIEMTNDEARRALKSSEVLATVMSVILTLLTFLMFRQHPYVTPGFLVIAAFWAIVTVVADWTTLEIMMEHKKAATRTDFAYGLLLLILGVGYGLEIMVLVSGA